MTFEIILEVFDQFISSQSQETLELVKSRHGYVFLEWMLNYKHADAAAVCTAPEQMLEFLARRYRAALVLDRTKGLRDELTPDEEEEIDRELGQMLDRI